MIGNEERAFIFKEVNFLKNQFNSHITSNFLNYCYNRIHKSSLETAEAIDIFSRMFRYSLNNKANEKVPLKNEIDYMKDFIKLQGLLSTETHISFLIQNYDYNSISIFPQILITFVENAFKHGNINSSSNPILIDISFSHNFLNFKVMNEKNGKVVEYSGIGHYNVKKRLDLFYNGKYYLEIKDFNNIYLIDLKLNTN